MTRTQFGETWVYESIVGALPGIHLTDGEAIALQLGLFEVFVVFFAWAYDLWEAVLPGSIAVGVAAVGSVVMLRMGQTTRETNLPDAYTRLLFGSSIEVVLGVLAFVALVTHLFVYDPRQSGTTLFVSLFGREPPVIVVYLTLLVLWDLCYRIGTSWWAAIVSLWGSLRFTVDSTTAQTLRVADAWNVIFGIAQLALVPFILNQRMLLLAVAGHVVAVTVVSTVAAVTMRIE
ncbi:hypothetical protein GL213_00635 [Halogeometricum borinquense]|uniref:Uncharacterized protein n=2 Tax=Halogeometricum borinquense TaxID=60847 RepID=E4NS53_HALBP|nr:hypothetical protein [Halogeometricum borinquense]ADQ65738.1 hypothetical protein Hbor_01270 [Halogeometricum borinquense DSM 11551]ELY26742.1 hypothetical protein C499_11066 [Halogeometricum borinquense DSM 11551]QIB72865.1 hypothetical protein G3I44_00315 [Halogeometricum borinquense]QIQ75176.1 hypothetical protein GL213_00635 [Halogeometricum borinquense]RYJ15077.1 hypothetical protein ELS19_14740 [Halogeometricum borinquense]